MFGTTHQFDPDKSVQYSQQSGSHQSHPSQAADQSSYTRNQSKSAQTLNHRLKMISSASTIYQSKKPAKSDDSMRINQSSKSADNQFTFHSSMVLRVVCSIQYRQNCLLTTCLLICFIAVGQAQPGQSQQLPETLQTFGGIISENVTLRKFNGPYRINRDILVESGATLTIQTGTELYFDPGVGIKVHGTLYAVAVPHARIQMLPYAQYNPSVDEDFTSFPELRLVDGPSTRQGRLEMLFRDRWRAVCSQNTNWTSIDFNTACRSMGFGSGGFWRWYRRNNDTYPLVMPRPACSMNDENMWSCEGFLNHDRIPLSENLCQGEDDVGIVCWGPPSFPGWDKHWKGIQFISAPFENVFNDPNKIGTMKQSLSRLEHVNIRYAGYDNSTGNSTAAIVVQGVAPFMNYLDVTHSARDGIRIGETDALVMVANSTVSRNRGRGIVVESTVDGRLFINETKVEFNYGDGVWYRQKGKKRQIRYNEYTKPLVNFCNQHELRRDLAFPYLLEAFLPNNTQISVQDNRFPCFVALKLPARFNYAYNFQFMSIVNKNPTFSPSTTQLIICNGFENGEPMCDGPEIYRIPIHHGILPQTVHTKNVGKPVLIALSHQNPQETRVLGDISVKFRVHATVPNSVYYGLNISNSRIESNVGRGVFATEIRDRFCITNTTVSNNAMSGVLIREGAANVWINDTRIANNRRDGLNVTLAGGNILINGTKLMNNGLRGATFHHNDTPPFLAMEQGIRFHGRAGNQRYFKPTEISDNQWGGVIIGNFCASALYPLLKPFVAMDYVILERNQYHPAVEYHSCQHGRQQAVTQVSVTGCRIQGSTGFAMRFEPLINAKLTIHSNQVLYNQRALLIRNRDYPQLSELPARVHVYKNRFIDNTGPYVVNIGLNEGAGEQSLLFNQQNEIKNNMIINPYPFLNPRTTPFAAVVVSSSNTRITQNCFDNPKALYELATDLPEHGKYIDATVNSWGSNDGVAGFAYKIFDQFYRYNLATIDYIPYALRCNAQNPGRSNTGLTFTRKYERQEAEGKLGGMIYGNEDIPEGTWKIMDDLHILPGARVTISPGAELQFENGIGMLVQGELLNQGFSRSRNQRILFTKRNRNIPRAENIRLIQGQDNTDVTSGRLEVKVDNQWGTVCNRSWTVELASKACHQLGLVIDPEFLENWVTYPPNRGPLPMIMDNIRCEEAEWYLTKCRHDGPLHNINASCPINAVVGLRCVEPHWAGVRYSLLANPPIVTGQRPMEHWTVEKAGLFDFARPEFTAALQIDWNYHNFEDVIIRDNFWNGLDIVYNDLTMKPTIMNSQFLRNRRHGIRLRSVGLTIENAVINQNENGGVRYNPIVNARLQRDVVTWLMSRNMDEMELNHVYVIPSRKVQRGINLQPSAENSRRFLVAQHTQLCPEFSQDECVFSFTVTSENGFIGIQIVNRPSNVSDENVIITNAESRSWNLRESLIRFPLLLKSNSATFRYSRSKGDPELILLILHLGREQYLDRFVHVLKSEVSDNQYGISTLHYSNFTHWDGSSINRWEKETLWFQKCNFTRNKEAVVWVNGPLRDVYSESPLAEITYKIDNCSVTMNNGSIIETHRDLHSSANLFHWDVWSSTFQGNSMSGISVTLPDTYNLLARQHHRFKLTESRFYHNRDFKLELAGYYSWVNISSNNFTNNQARPRDGLIHIRGMEKELIMERNRWKFNKGHWMIKYDIQSQTIKPNKLVVPASIRYNYLDQNYFMNRDNEYEIINWPRSFAVGIFGIQMVNINFNRLNNFNMDYETVIGLQSADRIFAPANISHNWWGSAGDSPQGIIQRIFDFDDWNIYTLGECSPYFVSEENFIDWWWRPKLGQLLKLTDEEPSIFDLKGRMFTDKTMKRNRQKWPSFPFYYKPETPYFITSDLTIMPEATLTIEKGVMVHIYPNVRILVLGSLIAEGTFWDPIRFRPINMTEYAGLTQPDFNLRQANSRHRRDLIYRKFPMLNRQDGFYQKFKVFLVGAESKNKGFLEIYNSTTGEMVPICDRQFTRRNAEVVCRELGYETRNVYSWVTPRWDYDPRVRIIRSYSEPRQCFGNEARLSDCDLRLNGDRDLWYCGDSEHFVFIHCAPNSNLESKFVGPFGGIMFSALSLEASQLTTKDKESVLRHVEIVGGGMAHNDSTSSAALSIVYRSPTLESVNVTNSSMHAVQILAPRREVRLSQINITDNQGVGLNVLALNLQSSATTADSPLNNLTIPYHVFGMLDICSVGKEVTVENRILVYFKYDSYPVDCVKYFTSQISARTLQFRFLQLNLYDANDPAGRPDALRFYSSRDFDPSNYIGGYGRTLKPSVTKITSPGDLLGVHLRANAADGVYGFVAEVASLPAAPDNAPVQSVVLEDSRLLRNDRGAFRMGAAGETSPDVIVSRTYIGGNGRHLWGNLSTSDMAVSFDLFNTQHLRLVGCMLWKNQGGLSVKSGSSSSITSLKGLVKNSVFAQNEYFETLRLEGKNFQHFYVINNYFGKNRARYRDIVLVDHVVANFSHNIFYNNTGTHIVDMTGYPGQMQDYETFLRNYLYENIALGHGYQFSERYGYLPPMTDHYRQQQRRPSWRSRRRRRKRQADRTSFDWWAHVGPETERYRSTILAGSSQQHYEFNVFHNPLNDFELTTVNKTSLDTERHSVHAANNYWGYPGTVGVAAGKIRDEGDYRYLLKVQYTPVLESNASLLQGGCPGGWFLAGSEEFKDCYVYVPGAMNYADAVEFCKDQGGILPYFSPGDPRLETIAARLQSFTTEYVLDLERFSAYPPEESIKFWYSGVSIPTGHCGAVDSNTGQLDENYNCAKLLPFVCGTSESKRPFLWTVAGLAVVIAGSVLLCLLLMLVFGWWWKSRRRKEQHFKRKNSLRESIRSNKMAKDTLKKKLPNDYVTNGKSMSGPGRPRSPVDIMEAHKNMIIGKNSPSIDSIVKPAPAPSYGLDGSLTSVSDDAVTTTTAMSYTPKKVPPYETSDGRSDYGSGSFPATTLYSSTHQLMTNSPKKRLHNQGKDDDQLSSFKAPSSSIGVTDINFRGGQKVVGGRSGQRGRHRDTELTEATSTTVTDDTTMTARTCSTCPTNSYVSYQPSGVDSRYSRTTSVTSGTSYSSTASPRGGGGGGRHHHRRDEDLSYVSDDGTFTEDFDDEDEDEDEDGQATTGRETLATEMMDDSRASSTIYQVPDALIGGDSLVPPPNPPNLPPPNRHGFPPLPTASSRGVGGIEEFQNAQNSRRQQQQQQQQQRHPSSTVHNSPSKRPLDQPPPPPARPSRHPPNTNINGRGPSATVTNSSYPNLAYNPSNDTSGSSSNGVMSPPLDHGTSLGNIGYHTSHSQLQNSNAHTNSSAQRYNSNPAYIHRQNQPEDDSAGGAYMNWQPPQSNINNVVQHPSTINNNDNNRLPPAAKRTGGSRKNSSPTDELPLETAM